MGKEGVILKVGLCGLIIATVSACLVNEPGYVPNSKEGIIASEKVTIFTPTPSIPKPSNSNKRSK